MAIPTKNIGILILAAGSSSRMGRPKQLLPWIDTTLLGNAIRNAVGSRSEAAFVVLGANAQLIRDKIGEGKVVFIENPSWELGLGSSIATGMDFLLKEQIDYDGILIMLTDQPLIDTDYLNLLITSFYDSPKNIIATAYGNRAGVPAIFDKSYFNELTQLTKDCGAKEIIIQNKDKVLTIDPQEKSIDIDTEAEYQHLIKKIK